MKPHTMRTNSPFLVFLFLTILSISTTSLKAQTPKEVDTDTTTYYKIQTTVGYAEGKIISEDSKELILEKTDGTKIIISIASIQVRSIIPNPNKIGPIVHPTRYLYAPSAIPLKRGEGYVNLIYGLAYQGQYGITDNISIGATTSIILQPTFFNFKIGGEIDKDIYVSAGGQVGKLGFADPESLGLLFANVTYGTREANITLNTGYGFYSQSKEQLPILAVSGLYQSSPKVSFVFEMWTLLHQDRKATFIGGPALRVNAFKKGFVDVGLLTAQVTIDEENWKYDPTTGNSQLVTERKRYDLWPIPYLSVGLTF